MSYVALKTGSPHSRGAGIVGALTITYFSIIYSAV